ncbi:lipopolysaccharide heptosyltransferase I [Acidihalobacter ferrooxydans]|uniref:Lipopolysaccharide heptosyltransferase 1 n=1 Tax=Acidihalobacter ferrooxydans TaxID=1765967 RepID=A0A1P8UE57_9GAMM|nr:lipopolysaccharide heptosyltransferase I [Acidihalobacter ferrooxydans]APZ42113.1 lipopolysaccharide heptosyltransferase I [Acidihalobacter ferrooxydans]
MRVLLVKMSSLGDVVHTLPAVTDAYHALPALSIDWVVEESLAEIPAWHPAVGTVLPIALRRWRRGWRASRAERQTFRQRLREQPYDRVLDAQGLLKSAAVARLARGPRWGLDRQSAREPLAALAYDHRVTVDKAQHAVPRLRQLFAAALGYAPPDTPADYGIAHDRLPPAQQRGDLLFLHGTTWATKHWPETHWQILAKQATHAGLRVLLPWGDATERARAERIAAAGDANLCTVLPRLSLGQLAGVLDTARAVVGVDTGLAHLAAALHVPAVTLYGPTRPDRTGTFGPGQVHLTAQFACAPCMRRTCRYRGPAHVWPACFGTLPPDRVWEALERLLRTRQEAAHGA